MTQDEIIRMAREAGCSAYETVMHKQMFEFTSLELERFAALVAEPWIETNKALAKEIIELKKQAEQEPGEWINEDELPEFYPYDDMYQSSKVINGVRMFPNVKVSDRSMFYALTKDHTWISVTETQFNKLKPECRMKCYIAPVRTKDLTDVEIAAALKLDLDLVTEVEFRDARAVIAADREKNK